MLTEAPGEGHDALGALRLATSAAHDRIDRLLALHAPFRLSHYARVLQGFDAFLASWEPQLARALPAPLGAWFEPRRRSALLIRDLAVLGIPRAQPASLDLPLAGTAAALGSLYVLEGAALGGQVIAQRLRRWHGIGTHDGGAYFAGAGPRTGPMWREFRQLLAREVADAAGRRQACTAAVATFDALTATFENCLHEPAAA